MKLLVDESAGRSTACYLRSRGYDVVLVQEVSPGIEDTEVCERANQEERVIVTNDKGFGRLIFQERIPNRGIILLRLRNEGAANRIRVISNLMMSYEERVKDHFVVASEAGVRIRPLPPYA